MRVYGHRRGSVFGVSRPLALAGATLLGLAVVSGGNWLVQRGEVVDGVRLGTTSLAGLSRQGVEATISRVVAKKLHVPVVVSAAGKTARVSPWNLGVRVDAAATADRALSAGRLRGGLLFSLGYGTQIKPVLRMPSLFSAPGALAGATTAPVDAKLRFDPITGAATIRPGRPGVGFDRAAALRQIAASALGNGGAISLSTVPIDPSITTSTARTAEARVHKLLAGPLRLTLRGVPKGALTVRRLYEMLKVTPYKRAIGVKFDPTLVKARLTPLLGALVRAPRDAAWNYKSTTIGGSATVASSLNGISLNAKRTARAMTNGALLPRGKRVAAMSLMIARPRFTTAQAKALGITTVVGASVTDMGDSSANRIYNVNLLAQKLDGHLIAPGTAFSFNQVVGPRTADAGFREGKAIENGLLVKSIGGGVCQVATTVFGAAFFGGYQILSRHNHSFYISHYPKGLDATVADGGFDLVFRNDTDSTIVMRTKATPTAMTVVLLSKPTGRRVTQATSQPSHFSDPGTRYIADSTVGDATLTQQTTGEQGFDITVTRSVFEGEKLVSKQPFSSHYTAEDVVFQVGKGATVPADVSVEGAGPNWAKAAVSTDTTSTDTSSTGITSTSTTDTGTSATTPLTTPSGAATATTNG